MKKYFKFIIFCVLIFSLIFLSCNNILLSKGSSLSIRLPGTEQSRFAFVKPESLDSFTIILTKKNGKTQEKTAKAGETIVFDSLTADTYTVSAKAFDEDNNCAAYAQEEVLIKPKQNTNLVLNLTWNLLTEEAIINNEVDFVVTPPKKTTYTLGEYFDPTGLKVEAIFKNGYRQEIPALIQSDTGPSQPIYYILEPDSESQINTYTSYQITVTIEYLADIGSNYGSPTIDKPFTLTLNVPKPTILRGPTIDNNSNTSNNGKTATLVLETTEPQGFEDLGYIQEFQWYIVENGEAKKLEDNSSPDIPEHPYYRGTTEQILTITFDTDDTNTYQYYCKVTNTIQETADEIPGITYGKTTATTKSKIVTVTTKGSSSDPGTTTTPTVPSSNYKIGDVYEQNGTPMGVVFEVDADNSYIKIVALKDLSSDDGTTAIFKLADTGWIDVNTYPVAYNAEDGSINSEGFLDFVNSLEGENFDYTTDLPAFNLTWNYYVENAEDPQATAGTFTWYIPAINELEKIVMDTTGKITSALNENGTKLEGSYYWSSTLETNDSQPYSEIAYLMWVSSKTKESKNVETACCVRPVKKIAL